MNTRTILLTLVLSLLAEGASADSLAFVGGTIIDGNGKVIENGVLLTDGDRIAAVGGKGTAVPSRAKKIDAKNKFIIPGLMDANVHLLLDISLENLVRNEGRYPELIVEAAQVSLKNGLTTVFDSWGPRAALIEARRRINAGEVPGARIYLAGNIVGFGGPISTDFRGGAASVASKNLIDRINGQWEENVGHGLLWMSDEQLREQIRAYTATGIDFIKYGASGHSFTEMRFILFSDGAQRAIVEEAHRAGLTVQTHTSSLESFHMAVNAGVDLMQHCETTGLRPLTDELLKLLVDKQIPCAVLAQTDHRLAWYRQLADEPNIGEFFGVIHPIKDQNVRAMLKAGARILLSTDAGLHNPDSGSDATSKKIAGDGQDVLMELGSGHFVWLRAMQEKGMEPMAMLQAATREIAKAYKVDKDLGTLEAGKMADLVVLDRNPLQSAENYRAIAQVVKSGKVIDHRALPVQRLLTSAVKN